MSRPKVFIAQLDHLQWSCLFQDQTGQYWHCGSIYKEAYQGWKMDDRLCGFLGLEKRIRLGYYAQEAKRDVRHLVRKRVQELEERRLRRIPDESEN